jgi:hypothetical protein
VDNLTEWPEAYTIPSEEASAVVEVIFYSFGVPQSDTVARAITFESCLMQEVLRCLRVNKTYHTCNLMAGSNATSKWLRNTYKKSLLCTGQIGRKDYPSFSLFIGHSLLTLWA